MNPFEDIHEEKWDKNSVSKTYTECSLSGKFKCIDNYNPYQSVEFSETLIAPIRISAIMYHVEHLHNATLGMNPTDIHDLHQTIVLTHRSEDENTLVTWTIVSSFAIDEKILDFPLSKSYTLQHKDVGTFLYDFDRISYNVLCFMRAIKEIYHKPSFAVINR